MHNKLASIACDFTVSLLSILPLKTLGHLFEQSGTNEKGILDSINDLLWEQGGYLFFSVVLLFCIFL